MSWLDTCEFLDEEVKELLRNSKYRKATYYEPCTQNNISDCLIGLHDELGILNMKYIFNPYTDIESETLTKEATIHLVNAAWSLLQHYKKCSDNNKSTMERNHALEANNQHLNKLIDRQKQEIAKLNSELKECLSESRKIAEKATDKITESTDLKMKLKQLKTQKNASEHSLKVEINKLKAEINNLTDKYNGKIGTSAAKNNNYVLERFREKEKLYKDVIIKLQKTNAELVKEVTLLKDELLADNFADVNLDET